MKKIFFLSFVLITVLVGLQMEKSCAQGAAVNSTGVPADVSAILDVSSTTSGALVPRMNTSQINAISLPATGLLIYNTDCNVMMYNAGTPTTPNWEQMNDSPNMPATPGVITGNPSVCPSSTNQVYTIVPVSGASSYNWTVPSGATIIANSGTSITVDFGAYTTGSITVSATNNCGTSGQCLLSVYQNTICPPITFFYSGNITTFTVPYGVTTLTIDAYGAQGGSINSYQGGMGAEVKGTFAVTTGQVLKILVGQQGQSNASPCYYAGGGGGTFVTDTNAIPTPYVVAGGGSGATQSSAGQNASATSANGDNSNCCSGGTAGSGGVSTTGSAGGGGLLGDGASRTNSSGSCSVLNNLTIAGGSSFIHGGAGGPRTNALMSGDGGYGGGSGGDWNCSDSGGAGGGYSGGAGANWGIAGSGGSYNGGTNQTNISAANSGHGKVIITY